MGACLDLTKLTWSGYMSEGKRQSSWEASILAYIFKSEFSNETGLKLVRVVGGFPGLGRVTIRTCRDSVRKEAALAA